MNLVIMGNGAMGKIAGELAEEYPDIDTVETLEPRNGESLFDLRMRPDVIIDFSHPDVLSEICDYLKLQGGQTGVVFATTGFSETDLECIQKLSHCVPVIQSYNYSFGVNAMKRLLHMAVSLLQNHADIEIIEKHHRKKVDAPSGTALMLADICNAQKEHILLYGRHGEMHRRNEIGMHSVRGGTIFGEHTVLFALEDEVIEVRHTAFSKKIFAKGAIEAALWLNGKKAGIYPLEQVFY